MVGGLQPWYDSRIHQVHCPNITSFSQIQTSIDYWIEKYGGINKIAMREISFFSHSGLQGPIIYGAYKHDPKEILIQIASGKHQQMKMDNWQQLIYHWHERSGNRLNFFGCRSGLSEGSKLSFAMQISSASNCLNVTVSGQLSYSYPSFYPDKRYTSVARSLGTGWGVGPTYMVASSGGNGDEALKIPPNKAITNKMGFFVNGQKIGDYYQSIFNDHRRPRNNISSIELNNIRYWQQHYG